jgi:hypothetical protein
VSTPRLNVGEIECVAGRRERFNWSLRLVDASGNRSGLGASDVVRFKLATTASGTPVLDIASGTPTAAGSKVTITTVGSSVIDAAGIVQLNRGDTSTLSGRYYFEIDVDDAGDSNRTQQPIRGTLLFLTSMGGTIGG